MTTTPLDQAHAAMMADGEDDTARLKFFERLADSEVFLLLNSEPNGDAIDPLVVEADGLSLVVGFDSETRLAEFHGQGAQYAAVPGRVLAQMLAAAGLGLTLNPEVAPSSIVLPPEALTWLADMITQVGPTAETADIAELSAPRDIPQTLLAALDEKLARASGLAVAAYLVATRDTKGGLGHVLAIVGAHSDAEPALARAVNEALTFSGLEAGQLDVTFFETDHPIVARLHRVGLRFDIPEPAAARVQAAPGSDPDAPPRLR